MGDVAFKVPLNRKSLDHKHFWVTARIVLVTEICSGLASKSNENTASMHKVELIDDQTDYRLSAIRVFEAAARI